MSLPAPAAPRFQFGSLLQLGLSALALANGILGAAGLIFLGFFADRSRIPLQLNPEVIAAWAWVALFLSLPAIPSLYYTLKRLLGKPVPAAKAGVAFRLASLALLLFPLALAIGSLSTRSPVLVRYVFPFAAILATCLPIWWAVELARRHTDAGGPQRLWGALNFALYFSTPLVFIVETIGLILLVLAVAIWASTDGPALATIQQMQRALMQTNGDVETIRALYLPLFKQPLFLFGGYAIIAVLVPLVEELFKPLVLWFLLGRQPSAAAGLALGAVAGAGFAIPETLYNLAGAAANSSQWLALASGRLGTGLLHVCTAAITGMAIASVWRSGKIHLLALAYGLSVALHGLWNALTITSGLAGLLMTAEEARWVTIAATAGLVALAAWYVDLLYTLNRGLRRAPTIESASK